MNKEDLYIGMRVRVLTSNTSYVYNVPGTIIDISCQVPEYDCLIEFDKFVHGHSGLGWSKVEGRKGYCYFASARMVEEIRDDSTPNCNMSYDDIMNGVVAFAESAHSSIEF